MFLLPSILRWRRSAPRWRSLCELTNGGEAALVSARCKFSLSTVEVMCDRAATTCALVEQEHADVWRWAVFGVDDVACREGEAPTRTAARRAAVKALVTLDRQGVVKLPEEKPPLGDVEHHLAFNR
jgi:hypothetical protein